MSGVGTILMAVGLISLIAAAVGALGRWHARRRAAAWARRPHTHAWVPVGARAEVEATEVLEQCRLCAALQARELPGRWAVNTLGTLVPVGQDDDLERMWRSR